MAASCLGLMVAIALVAVEAGFARDQMEATIVPDLEAVGFAPMAEALEDLVVASEAVTVFGRMEAVGIAPMAEVGIDPTGIGATIFRLVTITR